MEPKLNILATDLVQADKDVREGCFMTDCEECKYADTGDCRAYATADKLTKIGWRKVEKDQVILNKEDYEYLCACETDYKEVRQVAEQDVAKEIIGLADEVIQLLDGIKVDENNQAFFNAGLRILQTKIMERYGV